MANRECLALRAEHHFLIRNRATHTNGVNPNVGRTPRTSRTWNGFVGSGILGPLAAGCGHSLCRCHCRARRRICFGVVMDFDDLCGVEERRGDFCKPHHQHGSDREVWRNQAVATTELLFERCDVCVVETRRTHHRVHAVQRKPRQGDPGGSRNGEIDDNIDLGVGQGLQLATDRYTLGSDVTGGVDSRNQLQR